MLPAVLQGLFLKRQPATTSGSKRSADATMKLERVSAPSLLGDCSGALLALESKTHKLSTWVHTRMKFNQA